MFELTIKNGVNTGRRIAINAKMVIAVINTTGGGCRLWLSVSNDPLQLDVFESYEVVFPGIKKALSE